MLKQVGHIFSFEGKLVTFFFLIEFQLTVSIFVIFAFYHPIKTLINF